MEWVRVTALAAAPKPERSFMLLDFFFFFFKLGVKWSLLSSAMNRNQVFFFPSFIFCPTDEERRLQTVPAYISGWVAVTQCPVIQSPFSLSSMLMNPYPTSLCWRHAWNCPTKHSANVTAWLTREHCWCFCWSCVSAQNSSDVINIHCMLTNTHQICWLNR